MRQRNIRGGVSAGGARAASGDVGSGAESTSAQSLLDTALERFKTSEEATEEVRKKSLNDFDFRYGEQYTPEVLNLRKGQNLPCLTINRIPSSLKLITNEYRQQRPSPQIDPVGDDADQDTAEILQGMVRHISNISDAEIARDTAFEHMVTGGWGAYRIRTKFIDDTSFDQELYIEGIENPFAVYWDPYCSFLYPERANFCFIVDDPSPDDYKAEYPDSELAKSNCAFTGTGNAPSGWLSKDVVRVAEYFFVKQEKTKLYLLRDGTITKTKPDNGNDVLQDRDVVARKVKWAKLNAVEILSQTDWLGQWIPVIPMYGDASKINGKLRIMGMVRDAKDPQRSYNYWTSRAAEACQVAPKAPWRVVAGQIEKYKKIWESSNILNPAVLPYVHIEGAPPPERITAEPPIQAMMEMVRQSGNDFQVVTNLFDASAGKTKADESGKAVLERQKQGETANSNYSDNAARAIRYETRILIDAIPKYYTKEKMQRIINPDGTVKQVKITNSRALGSGEMGDTPETENEPGN